MLLSLPLREAVWFLPLVLPICLWVSYCDLSEMRIPNGAVLGLAAVFLLAGPFLMPLEAVGVRLLQGLAILCLGFVVFAVMNVGAGDAKFAAAMALFVAPGDALDLLMIFSSMLILFFLGHRVAARIGPLRRATLGWASWDAGMLFPMGISLSGTLICYLSLGLAVGL